jgi:predicted RNA-binding protein with PUA-like domain
MKAGDKLVIYHTGTERRAVGTASVASVGDAEAKDPKVKIWVGHEISHPRNLAEIKAANVFKDSPLVKQGRLSVVPLTTEQYDWLVASS